MTTELASDVQGVHMYASDKRINDVAVRTNSSGKGLATWCEYTGCKKTSSDYVCWWNDGYEKYGHFCHEHAAKMREDV